MTNGYIVLTKGEPNLYKHAVEAINLGKPIYFVDAENEAIYFGTKIALEDADVVIDAGKYTVTIEADNDVLVTTSLDLSIIEDSNGNKRFIEGSITNPISDKITMTFGKWSLSGSHLLIVMAGTINANAAFGDDEVLGVCQNLPAWIINKIIPLKSVYVDWKTFTVVAADSWTLSNFKTQLRKSSNIISISKQEAETITNKTNFRFTFDLLIDNE